ncbi:MULTISPECIES: mannitol dehydrogenase family protein [Clostridium]|uniref:mannitol dehydrogenase family protein n=1 Tax=Clostridium TaxID=1485 RepID=UPI0008245B2B|nr:MULTISPECIES: mannitol dehydrogenase family protein [Clostridium]PJI09704.1 mannitol dehydrogenase family protein [Clostridium sp. CT7]
MLNLSSESIKNQSIWENKKVELPKFDYEKMSQNTIENPTWVHFGAGNIFRGFIASLQQKLLNSGKVKTGIIAAETYDYEIIDKIYKPYDNLSLQVIMNPDGKLDKTVIASIGESIAADTERKESWNRLNTIFSKPSLKMVSFTITEKGYNLKKLSGEFTDEVNSDIDNGPSKPSNVMSKVTSLLYTRFKNGELPIAVVSMDNCSHNGEKLYNAVNTIANKWFEKGLVEKEFVSYINNTNKVTFPWSMIDKITPRPSKSVEEKLKDLGLQNIDPIITNKHTYIAPFVNTERPQYLVIEDDFPNGRIPLEDAGVYFTDRETVEKVERMKVCTCLNPLHTSMAVFGCLLGYNLIADEMKDECIRKLVEKIGYKEGMPVVTDPGILNPKDFIKEVIEVRLPNAYIPDTPQRIATDTSQKVGIRFGETIKEYIRREDLDVKSLKYIPMVIAAWCRYMLGIDDKGEKFEISSDPLLETLKQYLSEVNIGSEYKNGTLKPILSNKDIFGSDLYQVGIGEKVESYFAEMIKGKGAVRDTLKKSLNFK